MLTRMWLDHLAEGFRALSGGSSNSTQPATTRIAPSEDYLGDELDLAYDEDVDDAATAKFFTFNLTTTLTSAQAVAVVLAIGLGLALLSGLLFLLLLSMGKNKGSSGSYGYSDGDDDYSKRRATEDEPVTDGSGVFSTVLRALEGGSLSRDIKRPREGEEYYEGLKVCVNMATSMGRDEDARAQMLKECYKSIKTR